MTYALLLTADDILSAQFHKMCAVTQSELVITQDPTPEALAGAYRVFVDQTLAVPPFVHASVVVLANENVSAQTWQLALSLNAEYVEVLPSTSDWLVEHLVAPSDMHARTIVVVPAVGGAGASTLSCALSSHYVQRGLKVCLIDADPRAGGLDVLMGCEQASGLRWTDVTSIQGEVPAQELLNSLIVSNGIHLLTHRREQFQTDYADIARMHKALSSVCDVVVIDAPRLTEEVTKQLIADCDSTLIVTPTTVQASSVITSVKPALAAAGSGLVVRQIPGSGLTPVGIAQALEIPVLATLPTDARIVEQIEQGLGLGHVTLGAFTRSVNQLCSSLELNNDLCAAS
jgi:secretion/DNA translocation related CpaE-like protein